MRLTLVETCQAREEVGNLVSIYDELIVEPGFVHERLSETRTACVLEADKDVKGRADRQVLDLVDGAKDFQRALDSAEVKGLALASRFVMFEYKEQRFIRNR